MSLEKFDNRCLADHPMITQERDSARGHYIVSRVYESGDSEAVAIFLDSDQTLKRGGGAKRKASEKGAMDIRTLRKSVARSRTAIRRKLMSFQADRMLTLTFRDNVQDIDEAWACFKYFCKLMRWRYGEQFRYVVVPEYQKRGAVHFHMAIQGFYSVKTVRKFWLKAVGDRQGNIDITSPRSGIDKNSWNPKRISNYLAKYLSKHDSVAINRRRYASGGNIQVPEPERGWVCLGASAVHVVRDALEAITRKPLITIRDVGEGYFPLIYFST